MSFVWKKIAGSDDGRVETPVRRVTAEGNSRIQTAAKEIRMLDGRPMPGIGNMPAEGGFYEGDIGRVSAGTLCSPVSQVNQTTSPSDKDAQIWGWDPNKREDRVTIAKTSDDVSTAFLVDEEQGREERSACTAFNGVVNSAEKASFNTSYDSGVFSSYDSEVNSDDNAVVE